VGLATGVGRGAGVGLGAGRRTATGAAACGAGLGGYIEAAGAAARGPSFAKRFAFILPSAQTQQDNIPIGPSPSLLT